MSVVLGAPGALVAHVRADESAERCEGEAICEHPEGDAAAPAPGPRSGRHGPWYCGARFTCAASSLTVPLGWPNLMLRRP